MASGEVVLPQVDVRLPGILPLVLERTHLSSYRAGRLFGASWASTLDQRLEVGASGVCFATADGMLLDYPRPVPESRVWPEYGPRWPLSPAGDGGYTVTDPRTGREWHFPRPGPDGVSPIIAITDRNGNRIDFDRDDAGTLRGIRHSGGYAIVAEVGEGRLRALRPRTGTTRGWRTRHR